MSLADDGRLRRDTQNYNVRKQNSTSSHTAAANYVPPIGELSKSGTSTSTSGELANRCFYLH